MSMIIDGTNGLTFNNATTQASAGVVLQVVQTVLNTAFTTTSGSLTAITGLTCSITPKFSTSKILVLADVNGSTGTNNYYFQLQRGATAIYQGSGAGGGNPVNCSAALYPLSVYVEQFVHITYLDSPATTSSVTYQMYVGQDSAGYTIGINRRAGDTAFVFPSNVTLMEIAG